MTTWFRVYDEKGKYVGDAPFAERDRNFIPNVSCYRYHTSRKTKHTSIMKEGYHLAPETEEGARLWDAAQKKLCW